MARSVSETGSTRQGGNATQFDEKRDAILGAAFGRFAAYGFRRTSMADIAQAAGMSRPALYLHFRNKDDVYRSLVQSYFDRACAQMEHALAEDGPVEEVLLAAFRSKDTESMEAILTSPHGPELLDAKSTNSAEVVAEGEARFRALLAEWLKRGVAQGRISADVVGTAPEALAAAMLAALHGLKTPPVSIESYRSGQEQLARLFARALTA